MENTLLVAATLTSGFLVIYHHLCYPLILRWARQWQPAPVLEVPARHYASSDFDEDLPAITMLIPAYNEQRWIAHKIRNLAALDYPADRLRIIIACDGCSDNTAVLAAQTANEAECRHLSIEILNFKQNRGKVAIINEVVQHIETGLVALSDVSALVSIDALLIAAAHFEDHQLGVLNGRYKLLTPGSPGEAAYWRYQGNIKASEAALGSVLGAHGAFYLFRRSLFRPLAPDTINDDFILPMEIVAQGFRADYEERVNALELEQANDTMDRLRRRRIAAGNLQQLLRLKRMLLPRYGRLAFIFASGKGLRVLMPFLMIITLVGSLTLSSGHTLFALLAAAQLFAYTLAGWHIVFQPSRANRLGQTLAYLVNGHLAGLAGALNYTLGLEKGQWKRVDSNCSQ